MNWANMQLRNKPANLTQLACNAFINGSVHTKQLDKLFFTDPASTVTFYDANRSDDFHPEAIMQESFSRCHLFGNMPKEQFPFLHQMLYQTLMKRCADLKKLAEIIRCPTCYDHIRLNNQYEIDITQTLRAWLNHFLDQHPEINYKDSNIGCQHYIMALRVGDLRFYETLFNNACQNNEGQQFLVSSIREFYLGVESGAIDICQWYWSKADEETKSTLLVDRAGRLEGFYRRAAADGNLAIIQWLLAELRITSNEQIFQLALNAVFSDAAKFGHIDICTWLFTFTNEAQQITMMNEMSASDYAYIFANMDVTTSKYQAVIQFLMNMANTTQLELIHHIHSDKATILNWAFTLRKSSVCKQLLSAMKLDIKIDVFKTITHSPYNYSKHHEEIILFIWDEIPELPKLKLIETTRFFDAMITFNRLATCQLLWGIMSDNIKSQMMTSILYKNGSDNRSTFFDTVSNQYSPLILWLWKIADAAQKKRMFSIICRQLITPGVGIPSLEFMQWLWHIAQDMQESRPAAALSMLYKKAFQANRHEVCQWIHEQSTDQEFNKIISQVNFEYAFIQSLDHFGYDLCEPIWRKLTTVQQHCIAALYNCRSHGNHVYQWLNLHINDKLVKPLSIGRDHYSPLLAYFMAGNLIECQALWDTSNDKEQSLEHMTANFFVALNKGHLTVCQWGWSLISDEQKSQLLDTICLDDVHRFAERGQTDIHHWLCQIQQEFVANIPASKHSATLWGQRQHPKGDTINPVQQLLTVPQIRA